MQLLTEIYSCIWKCLPGTEQLSASSYKYVYIAIRF